MLMLECCACPHYRVLVHKWCFSRPRVLIRVLSSACADVVVKKLSFTDCLFQTRIISKSCVIPFRELQNHEAKLFASRGFVVFRFEFPNRDELISQLFERLFMADISPFIFFKPDAIKQPIYISAEKPAYNLGKSIQYFRSIFKQILLARR